MFQTNIQFKQIQTNKNLKNTVGGYRGNVKALSKELKNLYSSAKNVVSADRRWWSNAFSSTGTGFALMKSALYWRPLGAPRANSWVIVETKTLDRIWKKVSSTLSCICSKYLASSCTSSNSGFPETIIHLCDLTYSSPRLSTPLPQVVPRHLNQT